MAIRALVTTVRLTTEDMSYVKLATSTYYQKLAVDAYIDYSSKNQWIFEDVPINDVSFRLVEKNASETLEVTEEFGKDISKDGVVETLSILEDFVRTVTYEREFSDVFTLDDYSTIDKNFYGNKGNVAFITDTLGLTYDKLQEETLTISEVVVVTLTYIRTFLDNISVTDDKILEVSKTFEDSIILDDSSYINKDYVGYKGEVFGFIDILATSTVKELTEAIAVVEQKILNIEKEFNDNMSLAETINVILVSKRVLNGLPLNVLTLN